MKNPFSIPTVDNSNIPPEVYGIRPYLIAFSASWASAAFGYDGAFIGGTLSLPSFRRAFGLDKVPAAEVSALSSNIVSTFQGGAFFGSILGFFLAERFGRKPLLMVSMGVFIVGVVLQMLGIIGLFYAGRALTGAGVGGSVMILPIYISECSPALIRGRLVGIFEIMVQVAIVCGFWVNYGVSQNIESSTNLQWHVPVAVQFIPAGLLLICMPFNIESPRWLVSKNRLSQARKNLAWVRNLPEDHEYVQREMLEIQSSVAMEIELSGGRKDFKQLFLELVAPGVRNRVIISVLLMLLQNLTGINAINVYSPMLLEAIGYTGTSVSLLATGVYGIVKMLSTIVFMFFIVDRFGRRPPLLVGAFVIAITMYYLAAYSKLSGSFDGPVPRDSASKAALAMVYIFVICHSASWTGIPWIFASEVLPTRVRTLGMMAATCAQWVSQFIVVYPLPYMLTDIRYGTFLFFGSCTVVAFIFAWLFVPETKGVPLEDMDLIFSIDASIYAPTAMRRYKEAKAAGLDSIAVRFGKTDKAEHVEEA